MEQPIFKTVEFKSSEDQNRERAAENIELESNSSTQNELGITKATNNVIKEDLLKEKLDSEKKSSSVLNATVQKQCEPLHKLNVNCEEKKIELQRKSNIVSALEKLLENAEDGLEQEKTLRKRLKDQVEKLELKTSQADKTNEELALIVLAQEEELGEKNIVVNEQEVLIAALQAQILQLEEDVKEKNTKIDEKDKYVKVQTELENEKVQNEEKQKEIHKLRETLKEMDKEIIQHEKFIKNLQNVIEERDNEICNGKNFIDNLLREKSKLEAQFRSEVAATSSSSMNSQRQAWEKYKLKLLQRNKVLLRSERAKSAELVELRKMVAALNTKISSIEKDSQTGSQS